jgi:uncharacterized repeat protein (TIGR01451 family)
MMVVLGTLVGGGQQAWAAPKSADVGVDIADSPDPATAGSTVTYTVTASNAGPSSAANVTVTDDLDPRMTFDSTTSTQGSCTGSQHISCAIGTLASGATASITIEVRPTEAGASDVRRVYSDRPRMVDDGGDAGGDHGRKHRQ